MTTSKNGTILVVDDEEIMRDILETLLAREGYEVRLASSGEDGLALARSLPFDAAIVDIMMPGLNGIEVLSQFKRQDPRMEVVMMTSAQDEALAARAQAAGAAGFLRKPFYPSDVDAILYAFHGLRPPAA